MLLDGNQVVPEQVAVAPETPDAQPMTMSDLSAKLFDDMQGDVSSVSDVDALEDGVVTVPETVSPEAMQEPAPTVGDNAQVDNSMQPSQPVTLDDLAKVEGNIVSKVLDAVQQQRADGQVPQEPNAQDAQAQALEEAQTQDAPVFDKQEFLDKFYDDPEGAVRDYAEKIADTKVKAQMGTIQKELEPLLQQSRAVQQKEAVRGVIGSFLKGTPEAEGYIKDIANYIRNNNLPAEDANSYATAFRESKISRLGAENEQLRANQGKTLQDYLTDDASVGEIVNNQAIKDKVIQEYLEGLKAGQKPVTIQSGGTVQPFAQGANKPTSLKDAGNILKQQLNK